MNILVLELRRSFRSWLYFTLSLVAVFGIFSAFFNSFKMDAALINDLLQNFPQEFKAAFGFADVNLSKIEGYLSFIFSYLILIGAVFAMKQGLSLLSEEGRRHMSDFLLTKPIRRREVVAAKFTAVLIQLLMQNLVLFCGGQATIIWLIREDMDSRLYFLMCLSVLLVQLFFVSIGMLIATAAPKIKSVMPITLGTVFFFFIIELLNESIQDQKLAYLTPFAYYQGSDLISRRGYDPGFLVLNLAVFAVLASLSFWIYQKRDFYAG